MIYCFCNTEPPRISLGLLQQYSEWIQKKRLHIVEPPFKVGHSNYSVSQTLAFWAGKLITDYPAEETRIFIASEDTSLYNIVLWLRKEGYQVESSWPDLESVQCNDEILCMVLKVIQAVGASPPLTLDKFMEFLRQECKLPPYISLESVVKQMQERGFISLHRGQLQFDMPVFLDTLETNEPPKPPKSRRSRRHAPMFGYCE